MLYGQREDIVVRCGERFDAVREIQVAGNEPAGQRALQRHHGSMEKPCHSVVPSGMSIKTPSGWTSGAPKASRASSADKRWRWMRRTPSASLRVRTGWVGSA